MKQALIVVLCFLFAAVSVQAQTRRAEVTVLDSQGLPITGAKVTQTEQAGSPGVYDVRVEADGFEPQTITVDLRNQSTPIEVRLEPQRLSQEIIVAATRTEQRLGDIPASASVLHSDEIKASPAVVADDVLRQVPTFSLFRRTSSLAAHPTAQGVSLRGIGPSGVSRTLVLLDGTPFNDPFGGWVYWTRIPMMSVDRIEMVDGPNSSVYGNYAMGGVINVVTNQPQTRTLILKPQYGGRKDSGVWDGLGSLDVFASDTWKKFGVAIEGSGLNTNGYPIVPEKDLDGITPLRGRIDQKATVTYQNLNVKLDYKHSDRLSTFFRGGYFSENRSNAKFCAPTSCEEANDSLLKFVSGGVRARLADQSDLQASMFGNFETFHSSFLAVPAANPPRSIARLTTLQKVPAKDAGYMIQWSKALPGRQYFSIGTDWRWVDGDSVEDAFDAVTGTRVTLKRVVGGTQRSAGVFLQDIVSVTRRLQLTLSARLDHWKNYDAHSLETDAITGLPTANNRPTLADKKNTIGSPHAGLLYHVSDSVSVWGAVSSAFRAPTLNELYRSFAVGAVRTLANENLGAERLFGGEVGVNVAPLRSVTWRTTWFDNRVKSPVSNVTLPSPANTRQRQNLGKTAIWGIQSDVEYRIRTYWRLTGAYLYDTATVKEFAADRTLIGNFLPQVPRHRGSGQLVYSNSRYITAAIAAQFSSRQFEDDQNLLRLPGYGVVDVNFNRAISHNVDAFFGVQNLFDRTTYVQRNPTTIGAPRLITGGFRLTFSGR
jgi:outer membrane receptor protein involved in Fe transport